MMNTMLRRASLAAFAALGAFLIAFGLIYARAQAMLPFHAAAVPAEMRAAVLPLYVALMALIGGSSAALGGLGLYLTFGPLRSGSKGAATALLGAYSIAFLTAAFVAERLARDAGAPTSWHIMGVLMAINALAYLAWLRREH